MCGIGEAEQRRRGIAALAVEQDAIAVGKFDQALADAHRADELPLELLGRNPRAAAIAAISALLTQT